MVQKQCANCVAETALFVCQKKVLQSDANEHFTYASSRARKQTNEQTNKTPIGVREKIDRKDEDEEENFEVTFVPVFG